ncbi:MAG: hypothetical protein JW920_07295 [Deltaproteobacteria bacterium]|nr:hypothetical protein [Deltaproteobacteria bacterium]
MRIRTLVITGILLALITAPAFAELPNYSLFTKYLIDLKGWDSGEPTGMNMNGPMGEMASANRQYTRNDMSLNAQILAGNAAQMAWGPFMMGVTIDSSEELVKTTEHKGYKEGIIYSKKDKSGSIMVPFVGTSIPAAFILEYENMNYETALEIAEQFPWKDIEKVFK